jgi:anti-sigma regulatory factor (Ser/Thr protein kinase)
MPVVFQVAPVPEEVAKARLLAGETASRWVGDEKLETTRLLVSELVTNSILHGGASGPLEVCMDAQADRLYVEVRDSGSGFAPRPRAMASAGTGGFGLFLVERLADRWGVARDGSTRVWFELDRSPSK